MIGSAHNSPKLQRVDTLVGGDKATETFRIYPAVAVRDRLQGEVNTRGRPVEGPFARRGSSRL